MLQAGHSKYLLLVWVGGGGVSK